MQYSSALGYVSTNDTGTLNSYLNLDSVKNKFPANLVFMYGKPEQKDLADKNILALYAIKTLDNGQAKLDGSHVSRASQQYDERGAPSINMDMDAEGTTFCFKLLKSLQGLQVIRHE